MIQDRPCPRCKATTTQEVHKCIIDSGAEFFGWRCQECQGWVPKKGGGTWISKEELTSFGLDLDGLPVIYDAGSRCAVCGIRNAELHHWLPVGLVGREEADKWPMDYLCKEHHDKWHRIVTPQLVQ